MLCKKITWTDYDGTERTEDFYFNLTQAELAMMDLSVAGGMRKRMEKLMQKQDTPVVMEVLRDMIKLSYGVKSDDGRKFLKSDEIFKDFEQTEAYSIFFMELFNKPGAAAEFFRGILPAKLGENFDAELKLLENQKRLPPAGV